jgi:hypothetical protein
MDYKIGRNWAEGNQAVHYLQNAFSRENLDFLRAKIDRIEPSKDKIIEELVLRAGAEIFAAIKDPLEFPELDSPGWWDLVIKQVGNALENRTVCYLQGKTWTGDTFPALINPGHLPPNYRHTWLIRTKDIDAFRFLFDAIDLDWGNGDRLVVYNAKLAMSERWVFRSPADFQNLIIPCNLTLDDQAPYIQFYLILETGPNVVARTFRLWGLEVMHPPKPRLEALLVCDDLDYDDLSVPWIRAYATDGQLVSLGKPWATENITELVAGPLPKLVPEQGWYLLGKNINANPEKTKLGKFFSFVFYNERSGLLRAYLFNHDFDDTDISGYTVTFTIWAHGGHAPLEGAFFPVDPRPDQWGSVTIPIPHSWPKGSWAFVETPILYPMVKDLPGKVSGPAGSEPGSVSSQASLPRSKENEIYDSIYEDTIEGGPQNLRLRLTVQPFQKGAIGLDIFGKAVGQAIQDGGGASQLVVLFKKGKSVVDFFMMGRSTYESVNKALGAAAKSGLIAGLMSLGSTGWGAAFAVVGLVAELLSGDEPLRLSIELAIRAHAQGSVIIPGTEYEHEFYLPGKYNVQRAYADGLQKANILDTMSRYDRPLGNFGVRYNPALLSMTAGITGISNNGWVRCTFPAKLVQWVPSQYRSGPPALSVDNKIDRWLPIIVNPFADIAPFIPKVVDIDPNLNTATNWGDIDQFSPVPWFHFIQDISPKHAITPEPDDTAFPSSTKHGQGTRLFVQVYGPSDEDIFYLGGATWIPIDPHSGPYGFVEVTYIGTKDCDAARGLWMEILPVKYATNMSTKEVDQTPIVPGTYSDFTQIRSLLTHTWWCPGFSAWDEETGSCRGDAWLTWFPYLANKNADWSGVPLTTIFCHEQKYYYYGRTRKQNGKVILEEHSLPIYAKVQLNLLEWVVISFHATGGGGW